MRLSSLIETLKHKLVASITKVIKDTKELDKIIEKMDNATNIKENKYEIKSRNVCKNYKW